MVILSLLLCQVSWTAQDIVEATRAYLGQSTAQAPIKSVLIHPRQRAKLLGKAVFSRPSLPLSFISEKNHFKVHYTLSGTDAVEPTCTNSAGVPDFVYQAAQIAERCYSLLIDTLGLDVPPTDDLNDPQIDIYIKNWGGTTYAETYPEREVSSTARPYDYTAYTIIDNDYREYISKGLAGLQVTIAHELFHIVQLGYNWWPDNGLPGSSSDAYFLEWNSTWFEEYAYPEVNDYLAYLHYFFSNPVLPLWSDNYSYALGPFFKRIVERGDRLFVKRVWERIKTERALSALEQDIKSSQGDDLTRLWHDFMVACYFTGERYDARWALSADAQSFPLLTIPVANRGQFDSNLTFHTCVQNYAHQPFLIATSRETWLRLEVEVVEGRAIWGSNIIVNSYGTTRQTLVLPSAAVLGKFTHGDLLFTVVTSGDKEQSDSLTLKLTQAPDSSLFATKIKSLFPNPLITANGQDLHIMLQCNRITGFPQIKLFDVLGREAWNWLYPLQLSRAGSHELIIPKELLSAENLPTGVYFLTIDLGYQTVTGRFIYMK